MERASAKKLTGEPLDDPNAAKNPHAMVLGKLGGPKSGRESKEAHTRATADIAKIAAAARWKKR